KGGTSWGTNLDISTGTAPFKINGTTNSFLGERVAGIGDFNGDGYSDFAVAAPGYSGNQGQIQIYYGDQAGVSIGGTINGTTGQSLGMEMFSLGDINGDGKTDLMVGGNGNIGQIYLGGGSLTTPAASLDI